MFKLYKPMLNGIKYNSTGVRRCQASTDALLVITTLICYQYKCI